MVVMCSDFFIDCYDELRRCLDSDHSFPSQRSSDLALKAVPVGQWESGQALGLSKSAIFFRLVMPQMWRHALPGLGNQWLVLLKDTALVSLISVNDLMLQTKSIATRTQEPFTWYIVAAAIYLVITLLSQYILKRIDLRATRFERRPS